MATYNVTPAESGFLLEITTVGNEQQIADSIGGCASGECACSSDEFTKVESMDITSIDGKVLVDVITLEGQQIDPSCVSDCMTDLGIEPAAVAEASCACGGNC